MKSYLKWQNVGTVKSRVIAEDYYANFAEDMFLRAPLETFATSVQLGLYNWQNGQRILTLHA